MRKAIKITLINLLLLAIIYLGDKMTQSIEEILINSLLLTIICLQIKFLLPGPNKLLDIGVSIMLIISGCLLIFHIRGLL